MIKTVVAGAALALLTLAGSAQAAQPSALPGPTQPIPYAKLDAYQNASPKARANTDWWAGDTTAMGASTGASSNISATEPVTDGPATDNARTPSAGTNISATANPAGASQFEGATTTTTATGATPAQTRPDAR
jgi:hypothetical protein